MFQEKIDDLMDKMNVPVVDGKSGSDKWIHLILDFVYCTVFFDILFKCETFWLFNIHQKIAFIANSSTMIRRDPTRIELTLDDIQEYHIKGKMNYQKSVTS